jgi:hypothetical protein
MGIMDDKRYRKSYKKSSKLDRLDSNMDLLLMMEFRQTYWDQWVKFCHKHGYEPEVKE